MPNTLDLNRIKVDACLIRRAPM